MFRSGLLAATLFFVAAIALSGVLPLWLDEIIQLRETRNTTPAQLLASLPGQPGAAPLGYLVQQASLRATGYSVRWARFPSAVFGAGTVLVAALLGAEFELDAPWIAAALLALFPLTLRYAAESRIYSQALFFSLLSTLFFMRILRNSGRNSAWLNAFTYLLALTAAVYTQPYTAFVGIAHLLYALHHRDRRAAIRTGAALAIAVVAFLPWYLQSKANWSSGVAGAGIHFSYSAKTPLMLFRELAGAGYWGSGLLLILCILAIKENTRRRNLLILLIAVPVALALIADGLSGYFIATRQILWVLPAVALLAAGAFHAPFYKTNPIARPIAILLALVCLWQSYKYFTAPRENWQLAADALSNEADRGVCVTVVPKEQAYSYEFFRPGLAASHCPASQVALAFTPYATDTQRRSAVESLLASGYAKGSGYSAGKSEIVMFSK